MEDAVCMKTYNTKPIKTFQKQVALAEGTTVVVGGGENGCIHVFNRTTGQTTQTLQHSSNGRVQTIAVRENIHQLSIKLTYHQRHMTPGASILF